MENVFSVCQDNPERPTDNVNINAVGYGENPYHRVMQHEKAAIGVYNVATSYIQGKRYRIYVPFSKKGIKHRVESDGWVFCHTGTMMFAFKTLEPTTWQSTRFDVKDHDVLTLQDTTSRKGSWVLETTEITEKFKAGSREEELNLFKNEVLTKTSIQTVNYNTDSPTLKYTSLDGDVLELTFFPPSSAYNNYYKVNGIPLELSKEYIFNSPYVKQKNNSDEVILYNGNGEIENKLYWNQYSHIEEGESNECPYFIYPNPVDNELYISLPERNQKRYFSIYNSNGQLINGQNQLSPETLVVYPVNNLSAGIYFLRIADQEKNYSFKFIKN
jgi:hypothetical protein